MFYDTIFFVKYLLADTDIDIAGTKILSKLPYRQGRVSQTR